MGTPGPSVPFQAQRRNEHTLIIPPLFAVNRLTVGYGGWAIGEMWPLHREDRGRETMTASVGVGFLVWLWVVAGLPPWFLYGVSHQTYHSPQLCPAGLLTHRQ